MAENTSPKAKIYMTQLRQHSENILSLYWSIKQARGQQAEQVWGAEFPGNSNNDDTIDDGTVAPPTNYLANAIMSAETDFITWMEQGSPSRLQLLLKARHI